METSLIGQRWWRCADYMTDLSTAFLRQASVEKILEQHEAHRSHAGGGHGGGHQGGGGGERSGREVQYDPAILQGHLHQGLQKDHRRWLSGETDHVSMLLRFEISLLPALFGFYVWALLLGSLLQMDCIKAGCITLPVWRKSCVYKPDNPRWRAFSSFTFCVRSYNDPLHLCNV